jgi:hypothetical protein
MSDQSYLRRIPLCAFHHPDSTVRFCLYLGEPFGIVSDVRDVLNRYGNRSYPCTFTVPLVPLGRGSIISVDNLCQTLTEYMPGYPTEALRSRVHWYHKTKKLLFETPYLRKDNPNGDTVDVTVLQRFNG